MAFSIHISTEARDDIQQAILWYNGRKKGLGRNFFSAVQSAIQVLKVNPFFQIRYDNIRCLPVPKFPYMLHFSVDPAQQQVNIYAVLNTYRDTDAKDRT
jgi:hypothetical protein